jgi:hypothetical protein
MIHTAIYARLYDDDDTFYFKGYTYLTSQELTALQSTIYYRYIPTDYHASKQLQLFIIE